MNISPQQKNKIVYRLDSGGLSVGYLSRSTTKSGIQSRARLRRFRQVGDQSAGEVGVGAGRVHGVVDGAVAFEDLEDLRVGDALEAAVGEHGADGVALGRVPC